MEHEVQGHTKKIYKAWQDPRKKAIEKVKEIAVEIGIIVFAISLSIWFHSWSEHKHEQKEVKEFLIGLKDDLQSDIKEMNEDKESYKGSGAAYSYIISLKIGEIASKDSINKYAQFLFNTAGLNPNAGRFEGFKSSGKLGHIENEDLQNDILDLYVEDIPYLIVNTDSYTKRKNQLFEEVNKNSKRVTDSTNNIRMILSSDVVFSRATSLAYTANIIELYDIVINKNKKIIDAINKEYNILK